MRRVVVTGMGVVSSAGRGVPAAWEAAVRGDACYGVGSCGVRAGVGEADAGFDKPLGRIPRASSGLRFDPGKDVDPTVLLALEACREAVEQSGIGQSGVARSVHAERLGCVMGSGAGSQQTHDEAARLLYGEGRRRLHPLTVPRGMFSAVASAIAMEYGAKGPVYTVSSACASSTHAIGQATQTIRYGGADVMMAGGSEACLTKGCLAAWEALHLLARQYCRPFSSGRDGLVLSEGAAVFVLEEREHALCRGAGVLAEIVGYGACSDATALTAPDVGGMARAMRLAIGDAGLDAARICAINAHGTGTELNDRSECAAIVDVFGARHGVVPVTSTKSVLGHALGASGAIELAVSIRSLQEQFVPPTGNHVEYDVACPVDCVPNEGRAAELTTILSNSFAFGGLNASLVVRHARAA